MDKFLRFFEINLSSILLTMLVGFFFIVSYKYQVQAKSPAPVNVEAPKPIIRTDYHAFKDSLFEPYERSTLAFIRRFHKVAIDEQVKFNVPASVTLAQGILESGSGSSELATKHNIYFNIKCYSKTCKKGHCVNYADDDKDDRFKVCESAWYSFRHHSQFLQGKRYKPCHAEEWLGWCNCLQEKGYATDKNYAKKLLTIINRYKLYEFDGKYFAKS